MVDEGRTTAGAAEGAAGRFVPLRRLGWAFLLAWVFSVFYTDVLDGYVGALGEQAELLGLRLFFLAAPVTCSVAMLCLIVLLERRLGSPCEHPSLFVVAPVATSLATILLFCELPTVSATAAMFGAGAALTGFGSGFMWVMWGEFYARVTQEEAEFLAPASAVLASVLVLLVSAMEGWVALAAVVAFPLLSGLCLSLSWQDVRPGGAAAEYKAAEERRAIERAHDQARSSLARVLVQVGRDGFGILAACLFVCLVGSFWSPADHGAAGAQVAFVASIAFMLAVWISAVRGPRRVSLSFLYRWMCPAVVAGFAALVVAGPEAGGHVGYCVAIAARFSFCLITQMYFARYAVQGSATPVQSYGLGWIFVHLGDCLGVVALVAVDAAMEAGAVGVEQVAAVSMTLLVTATMFVLNDRHSFHFDVPLHVEEPAAPAPQDAVPDEPAPEPADGLSGRIAALARDGGLTPRETEVLDLLARGRSIPYVRDALVISRDTAATHAKHIYAKLGVHSRQELIDLVH